MPRKDGINLNQVLRHHAETIISASIQAVLPDAAVKRTLEKRSFPGRVILVAAGKAAWQMSKAACEVLGDTLHSGVCVTKYGHVMGALPHVTCYEAGHPVPDSGSVRGTQAALDAVAGLNEGDTVLFLLSGGGSALFEKPLISVEELQNITAQLLASGANITEINIIRKRLSAVKGGRFALACGKAKVLAIVLSDILGDPLDMIASGPVCPDSSTCAQAQAIAQKYHLHLSGKAEACLAIETPKHLSNVETEINGSVRELCSSAAAAAETLGYKSLVLTDQLCCLAKEAGSFLAAIARTHADSGTKLAFIAGGETVVQLTGKGMGGRNQELALAAAPGISGLHNVCVFSVGSDGTDGPTDAAGGYVDGDTEAQLHKSGKTVYEILSNNDAYHGLQATGGLIFTGPTGTNVNDIAVVLIDRKTCAIK